MNYKREDYIQLMRLYSHQEWLSTKETCLEELISICETNAQKGLLFSLLERFHYLRDETLNLFLNQIAEYITTCDIDVDKTQLVACTFDEEADSGQKILDMIKVPLYQRNWREIKTVNNIGKATKFVRQGKEHIIIIDEFLGTGKTLITRIEWLRKNINVKFDIQCCFIAGMRTAIESIEKMGVNVFCPLQLDKGISEYFTGDELKIAIDNMLSLESKLSPKINDKEINDYSLGYGKAEALYSLRNGNTPNSVFPIFWWIKDNKGNDRNTILTRYEMGF